MKRPDFAVPLGLLLGAVTIGGGALIEGVRLGFLWQPTAAMIVFGGTISAIVVRRGMGGLLQCVRAAARMFFHENLAEDNATIARVVWLSRSARREGVQVLEQHAANQRDPLLVQALTLVSQYVQPAVVRMQLQRILDYEDERGQREIATIEAAGGYTPTFGILGAVLGLIQVLRALAEPNALGAGIATAFVATIYGVGVANLLLFPLASRMRERHETRMRQRGALVEALVALAANDSPGEIAQRFAVNSSLAATIEAGEVRRAG